MWSMALYGAETWSLRKVDQKYLESFEIWCWWKYVNHLNRLCEEGRSIM